VAYFWTTLYIIILCLAAWMREKNEQYGNWIARFLHIQIKCYCSTRQLWHQRTMSFNGPRWGQLKHFWLTNFSMVNYIQNVYSFIFGVPNNAVEKNDKSCSEVLNIMTVADVEREEPTQYRHSSLDSTTRVVALATGLRQSVTDGQGGRRRESASHEEVYRSSLAARRLTRLSAGGGVGIGRRRC